MKFSLSKIFVSLLISAFVFPNFVSAQTTDGPWYNQNPTQFSKKVFGDPAGSNDGEIFGERYTFAQINWILNSLVLTFSPQYQGGGVKDILNKLQQGNNVSYRDLASLGLPGLLGGSVLEFYNHPLASGVESIHNTLAKFSIVQPAYAANNGGFGFTSLSAVALLWSASRNMAYLVMIVLLLVSGFLIMFRVKINPQTVVTLQTMIPKLIITLLLVTFSFAIAGLVIDLVYVIITFVIGMLNIPPGVIHPTNLGATIQFFTGPSIGPIVRYYLFIWIVLLSLGALIALIPAGFTQIGGGLLAIIALLITIFLAWTLLKIWWLLLKTYVTLLLLIIIGPWQIMLDLLPGQQGFGGWIRNVIANASVFVVVPLMFLINMIFWKPFFGLNNWGITQDVFDLITKFTGGFLNLSPLGPTNTGIGATSGLPNLPLVGNTGGLIFNFAIGFAILSLTPKIADMIRDALKLPAFKYGSAFGEATVQPYGMALRGVSIGSDIGKAWTTRFGTRTPTAPATPRITPPTPPIP